MLKRLFGLGLALWLFLGLGVKQGLAADKITIYFFHSNTCPHCRAEKPFLAKLEKKYDWLTVRALEINERKNNLLWQKVGLKLKARTGSVPFTVIGDQYIVGYLNEATTGEKIETMALTAKAEDWPDVVQAVIEPAEKKAVKIGGAPETLKLPLFGEVKTKAISLPFLTLVIALLDGFNPCAMWTLLFLISLLLGMKDRKRMWLLGMTFIAASGLVYFLMMTAWLNVFLLLGLTRWLRLAIGLFALAAGGYSLRQWQIDKEGGCETADDEKRQKIFSKLKALAGKEQLGLALGGIILLAAAVNLVEMACSAGLPAIYTEILALNKLASWQYYFYLLFYIFIFMLDDLAVFVIAMMTLKAVGIESKYARVSRLIGGVVMVLIGLAMLFKPGWLMFG